MCVVLMIRQDTYLSLHLTRWAQHTLWSSNAVLFQWRDYLWLREKNTLLREENAYLHTRLYGASHQPHSPYRPSADIDTLVHFIEAQVVYQTMTGLHNFMILNKGRLSGIEVGQGVISSRGLCGRVQHVGRDYSAAHALLHTEMRTSARLGKAGALGSLRWDGVDRRHAWLDDLPRHVQVNPGDTAYTSGYGSYPQGIPIGVVRHAQLDAGAIFYQIHIQILTDYSTLQHVYALSRPLSHTQDSLQTLMNTSATPP